MKGDGYVYDMLKSTGMTVGYFCRYRPEFTPRQVIEACKRYAEKTGADDIFPIFEPKRVAQ